MPTNKDYIVTLIMSAFITIMIIAAYDRVVSRFINHQINDALLEMNVSLDRDITLDGRVTSPSSLAREAIHLCLGHDSLSACDYVEELGASGAGGSGPEHSATRNKEQDP